MPGGIAGAIWATQRRLSQAADGDDDTATSLVHVVLLLVIMGVVLCSSLHVLQHRLGLLWIPEPAVSIVVGLAFGLLIRLNPYDDTALPNELGFSGTVFFLVLLPIIIFEGGYSLKKKEFFSQIGSILTFSVIGTVISGLSIGGLLYLVGQARWATALTFNEAMAYGSVLSTTDSLCTVQLLGGLGVDRSFQALAYGEGSVNEAVSLVMYDTFVHFIDDEGSDEAPGFAAEKFGSLLAGSVLIGLAVGVASTFLFRFVHMDWRPNPGRAMEPLLSVICCCCPRRNSGPDEFESARLALLRAAPAPPSARKPARSEAPRRPTPDASEAGMTAPGLGSVRAAVLAGLPIDFDPAAVVANPPSLAALRAAAARLTKSERIAAERKPTSSVFSQTTFILSMGYVSYMTAEAAHLSGVVAVLFTGIAMNHFVRPLLTREGKRFSEGTLKVLSQTSDTSIFFQVGLDMGLTIFTAGGIDSKEDGALLGWVILGILVGRALSIFVLAAIVNYFRRTPIPWQYLVALWHAGMRGAGTYAFTIIFPTANRNLLLDITAAVILFTVFALGSTTAPLMRYLGIPYDAAGSAHGDPEGEVGHKAAMADGESMLGHGGLRKEASSRAEGEGEGGGWGGLGPLGHIAGLHGQGVGLPSEASSAGGGSVGRSGRRPSLLGLRSSGSNYAIVTTDERGEGVIQRSPRLGAMLSPSASPALSRSRSGYGLRAAAGEAEGGGGGEGDAESGAVAITSRANVTYSMGSTGEQYGYASVPVKGGGSASVPVYRDPSASERAVSFVNSGLTVLRYYVSGVLRAE
jgi:NhaP-type Na+/H+ or K+/H+ antiporter